MSHERRQVERVRLREPIAAFIHNRRVWIVEIGLLGCRVEHNDLLNEGTSVTLLFHWAGEDVSIDCTVMHCAAQPVLMETREISIYHAGLEFGTSSVNATAAVRQIVAREVMQLLEVQKANARGESRGWAKDVSFFSRVHDESTARNVYIQCRVSSNGEWTRTPVYKPHQPLDGFTVGADTALDEIETLCRSYDEADAAGRHLIRLCAELSVTTSDDRLPLDKFRH